MKKKLVSLLLVVAVMLTSVSMGFGSISAFAAPAGEGVETIKAFSLTTEAATGNDFNTSITIKSKVAGYRIKVKSITGSIRYAENSTDTVGSVSIAYSEGTVCDANGASFAVSGDINGNTDKAGLAGIIRYECNYDLLDSNGNVVYAGLTGYGYGAVSANGEQKGAVGNYYTTEPSDPGSGYGFASFAQINSCYVDVSSITLNCVTEADSSTSVSGKSTEEYNMALSGNPPTTASVQNIKWDGCGAYKSTSLSINWFVLTEPASNYYNFSVIYRDDYNNPYANVEMYYRKGSDQQNALNKMNEHLNLCLEKSYYTPETWNNYIAELDKVAHAALAIPGPNVSYKMACQNVSAAATASALETAKNNLAFAPADYTEAYAAYDAFKAIKDNTVDVLTYTAGSTGFGKTTTRRYAQSAVDEIEAYVAGCNLNLYKHQQATVDGYTATIKNMTANLASADAVFTYLNNAIAEFEAHDSKLYTAKTWGDYQTQVTAAKNLGSSLKADSQGIIDGALKDIVKMKNNLEYVDADTVELQVQLDYADSHYDAYDAGYFFLAATGFDTLWESFNASYVNATKAKGYKIDKQQDVDEAAAELKELNEALDHYRALNLAELHEALALVNDLEYSEDKYTPESYKIWIALYNEGLDFLKKAGMDYTGDDRKTYADRNEMATLVEAIRGAFDGLKKISANFEELDSVIATIPKERDLAKYKDDVVQPIKDLLATVDYGKTFDEQEEVDELTENLRQAIAQLTSENYKGADYSKVEQAIAQANERIANNNYTEASRLNLRAAVDAVVYGKKIVDQEEVDGMADAINTAIRALEFKGADYTKVNEAIDRAATYNKDLYANYDRVEDLINNIDWDITIDKQDEVDAIAAAINKALDNLEYAIADYTGVNNAIAEAKKHEPFSRYTEGSVANLNAAISAVIPALTKDKQAEVDQMAGRIYAAIEALEPLPADYTDVEIAISYANSFKEENYQNYDVVTTAIGNINWDLNCLQTEEMEAQIQAIYDAVKALKLLPADYSKVLDAIENARNKYESTQYPYTQESIDALEAVIKPIEEEAKGDDSGKITKDKQNIVDNYVTQIDNATALLKYERANYDELNEQLARYEALEREYYDSLFDLDAYVSAIDMNITNDRQTEVDTYTKELKEMLDGLSYAPADYTAVDSAIRTFEAMNKDYFEEDDVEYVQSVIDTVVVRGYTKDQQAEVRKMASDINKAIDELRAKMKKAEVAELNAAIAEGEGKFTEMYASKYEVDMRTWAELQNLITTAKSYYNEDTKIDKQAEVDMMTEQIKQATANLQFIFTIDLEETDLIIDSDNGYIYGFEEGAFAEDAIELIKFVGPAEIKIIETSGYFGTGTRINFVSTKDGSLLASYTVIVFGDANGDAVVDMYDVAYVAQIVNFEQTPSDVDVKALDFDGSGTIDANELTTLISIANMECSIAQDGSMGIIY